MLGLPVDPGILDGFSGDHDPGAFKISDDKASPWQIQIEFRSRMTLPCFS
jgi:hypothetical protein